MSEAPLKKDSRQKRRAKEKRSTRQKAHNNRFENGDVLEKGEAARSRGNWWKFTTQARGSTILAEAWDLPKNLTKFVLK